jgi:hypothetical protein
MPGVATTQNEELARVNDRIGALVVAFCDLGPRQFHLHELEEFVMSRMAGITPGSPGRIMRDLRQRALLDYRLVSRRDSLYEVLPKPAPQTLPAPPKTPTPTVTAQAVQQRLSL